ncbi:LacI family transcriptional regulator [Motilibacter rhizosphaerae]|uniref:LacI family transcriptional regulator n=1 Tax=Motilibacter rhizosphaerae TaxID=598652 RepID=A0A4Q7NXH1_9ACTN|nr:LacI family transcriptional regulator [Motilibacter rhizosphaerae]
MAGRARARPAVPTLATVAAAAGVSPATVSRVVNSSAPVSPEHRAAVEAAIARLGYVPNRTARSLATRSTGALALVVREAVEFGVSDPYLSTFLISASSALAGSGLHLVVMAASDDAEHETVGAYVRSGHVDGALLVSVHAGDPLPGQLLAAGIPFVFGGRPPMELPDEVCVVDTDNLGGGRLAAQRLLSTGRSRVTAISGPVDMTAAADRVEGLRRGLDEAGVPLLGLAHGAWTRSSGEQAMTTLLADHPDLDAVFVASDTMAVGALKALSAAGRRVPDDVAVIGFDDVEVAAYATPPLTTVRQPTAEQARCAIEALVAHVRDGQAPPSVVLPTELVVRQSG